MADLHTVVFNSLSRELGARKRFVSLDEREEIAACIVAQLREEHLHVSLNQAALERLVRNAMGAGVACASERFRLGEVDRDGSLLDVFGDFPAEFLSIRSDLVEVLHNMAGES